MNNNSIHLPLLILIGLFAYMAYSQDVKSSKAPILQPTSIEGAESKVYKTIGDTKLMLHIFRGRELKTDEQRPAIVFFFGGGWMSGSVNQFVPHSKYLAERGMVAIIADYRVRLRHGVSPLECIADAKSAIRWVRMTANELDIDSNRIVAAGGSAGGHLAACTALLTGFEEKNEDRKVSSVPNALVLFNPALDLPDLMKSQPENMVELFSELRDRAEEISPIHHIQTGAPPTIIFHGTADKSVPFEQATRFCELMNNQDSYCEVVPFEGRPHAFFNYGRGDNTDYRTTLRKTDEFLVSLKYLKGEPTIK